MANPVTLVVDGGCTVQADNAPGSWAALLVAHKPDGTTVEKALSGTVENTTNNRMELTAVIEGLRALKQTGVCVEIVCDSQYVVCTMTKNWKRKTNHDLWAALDAVIAEKQAVLTWRWVRGHSGDPLNERVHKLVTQAR
ncbi:MAG: ribonuclease H family protein [Aggregatilineales bacterium]